MPRVVAAVVLGRELIEQRARPPHVRLVAGPEAVGDGQEIQRDGLLVPGLGAEHVLADALGLLRLVEQPVSLGLGERSRDGLGAQRLQLEHGRLLFGESFTTRPGAPEAHRTIRRRWNA